MNPDYNLSAEFSSGQFSEPDRGGEFGHLASILDRYDMALLRRVADELLRSRLQRGREELISSMSQTVANPVVIDRRLRDLTAPQKGVLALLGLVRRDRWELITILELLSALGANDGLSDVRQLFESGLLYPDVPVNGRLLRSFRQWLATAARQKRLVLVPPEAAARAAQHQDFQLADLPLAPSSANAASVHEADGLDWFLRLGILWQRVHEAPLRLTQQGEFFKKDDERLRADCLLAEGAGDEMAKVPQPAHALVAIALAAGLLRHEAGQIVAGEWPAAWDGELADAIGHIWSLLPQVQAWNEADGWRGLGASAAPYASARLLALALLARLPRDAWVRPESIGAWLAQRHCFWRGKGKPAANGISKDARRLHWSSALNAHPAVTWARAFLLGPAYQLRLVQAAPATAGDSHADSGSTTAKADSDGRWWVRLSALGRTVLGLEGPPSLPAFPRTLLVQPNLEILAYRQGLTPGLISALSRFAAWQTLGAACTLRLEPASVYRGLECGYGMEQTVGILAQHGVRELPSGVRESLRTWANKRDRLTVYSAATLLEFAAAEDLEAAVNRGLAGVRIADRLVLIADESAIEFRNFRLTGTRDYALPPGKCVEIEPDGVTLVVDPVRSDLLLETEMNRFATPMPHQNGADRRAYRVTPVSLAASVAPRMSLFALEEWFLHRTGQALSPAIRLLLSSAESPPLELRRLLVIETPTSQLADGLLQWPESRDLIQERLGPRALAIEDHNVDALRSKLDELRLSLQNGSNGHAPSNPAAET
jgi:hypothetical protein